MMVLEQIAAEWPCPRADGGFSSELILQCLRGRSQRVLIIPALLDEGNKLRRFTVEVMRRLDCLGIDCFLPDLPGCNESLEPLQRQTLSGWRNAVLAAADHVRATHVLTMRGGAQLAPRNRRGWAYAPVSSASQLRQMLRAHVLSAREAGIAVSTTDLLQRGRIWGLSLVGCHLGAGFIQEFEMDDLPLAESYTVISQQILGGTGLWLRAEPSEDAYQVDVLSQYLADALGVPRPGL